MIKWRKVYGMDTWFKGDSGAFYYQIIFRRNGWLYGETPEGKPWSLMQHGNGKKEVTYHETKSLAFAYAEDSRK